MNSDEIRIGKGFEEKEEKDIQLEVQKAMQEPEEETNFSDEGKNLLIMIAIVVGIFVFTIAGFKLYDHFTTAAVIDIDQLHKDNLVGDLNKEEGYIYNGYSFVKADGLWWTESNKFGTLLKIPLHFGPKEVEQIKVEGGLRPLINKGDAIYITIDPLVSDKYYTLGVSELSFNVAKGMDRIPNGACTEESIYCENRTIVSCENNPKNLPLIELELKNETSVVLSGTCIKISGYGYDLVKAVDRVLYQWYGIMKN